jgi:hypothetical protein
MLMATRCDDERTIIWVRPTTAPTEKEVAATSATDTIVRLNDHNSSLQASFLLIRGLLFDLVHLVATSYAHWIPGRSLMSAQSHEGITLTIEKGVLSKASGWCCSPSELPPRRPLKT